MGARSRQGKMQDLLTRRDRLNQMLDGQYVLLPARRLANDGLKAWAQVLERGCEGPVAKDRRRLTATVGHPSFPRPGIKRSEGLRLRAIGANICGISLTPERLMPFHGVTSRIDTAARP